MGVTPPAHPERVEGLGVIPRLTISHHIRSPLACPERVEGLVEGSSGRRPLQFPKIDKNDLQSNKYTFYSIRHEQKIYSNPKENPAQNARPPHQ